MCLTVEDFVLTKLTVKIDNRDKPYKGFQSQGQVDQTCT